jgi:hypothetical protein
VGLALMVYEKNGTSGEGQDDLLSLGWYGSIISNSSPESSSVS